MGIQSIDEIDQLLNERFAATPSKERKSTLSVDLHMDLMVIFHDPGSFSPETFGSYQMGEILAYLEATHRHYISKSLKNIRFAIDELAKGKPNLKELQTTLHQFFQFFEKDLTEHIGQEERVLFPYVRKLLEKGMGQDSAEKIELSEFLHDHDTNCEQVLERLICYLEDKMKEYPDYLSLRILLNRLTFFAKDLRVHSIIEDEVFIPRCMDLEQHLGKSAG